MYKQAIVIRKDLKMSLGKAISQACHASLGAYLLSNEKIKKFWENEGAKKIVLKVENLKELKDIYKKAKKEKLACFIVKDSGLTQLKKGTITALGIGPDLEEKIDKITGKLKLF